MPIAPGSRLGPYEIVAPLGAGGMGEVWRARDSRLNREVAIKVLPAALAGDSDYLARFTREAQVLASLNHPNIAAIYGVEDGALIMELVPGPTLEERIAAGPLPLEDALGIAAQIADALEAAHEKGVIHRDLKPANVKVTPEGLVKVLDFGLAKAPEATAAASGTSPTLTIRATQAGIILGTAAYMSPEQAAGKPVDRRADIWAFGVVLYEMLTGQPLFTGETVSHVLAAVLKDPIDFDLPQSPPPIRRLLARCLDRKAKDRLRDIGEARVAIRGYLANPTPPVESPAAAAATSPVRARRVVVPWAIAGALALMLAATFAWMRKSSPPLPVTRFSIALGPGETFPNSRSSLAISPDGTHFVYAANGQLYLRDLAASETHLIAGSSSGEMAMDPAFSPDGKFIAFFSSFNTLKRIAVSGGTAVTLCTALGNAGAAFGLEWGGEGILFASGKGILRVSPNGGQPAVLVAARNGEALADPVLLPDGQSVLFSLGDLSGGAAGSLSLSNRWSVVAQRLKSGERKVVVENARGARYLPTGHLVYWMNGVLFAAPFDVRRFVVTGPPVGVVEGVLSSIGAAHIAYSTNGTLIYRAGAVNSAQQDVLALADRKGDIESLKMPHGSYASPRVSHDGRRVVYQADEGAESSIWIWELDGSAAPRRLTLPGSGVNRFPIWSPDGQQVAFQSAREGDSGIWLQRADGSAPAEHITTPAKGVSHIPDSWSADGRTIAFTEEKDGGSAVWTWSIPDRKATVFASDPNARIGRSAFSPDGHWMVYQSQLASSFGYTRIYVRPFPPTETAYVAPQDGDMHHPVWSPDGKELFYVLGPSQSGSISITTRPTVSFGSPVRQPKSGFSTAGPTAVRTYDIFPDGRHFMGVVAAGQTSSGSSGSQIQVVLNWFEDVRQRMQEK